MRPLALCSGLLGFSRLDKLSGSGVMLFVWGGHWTWLWVNVETAAEPPGRERKKYTESNIDKDGKLDITVNNYNSRVLYFWYCQLLYPLVCVSGAGNV